MAKRKLKARAMLSEPYWVVEVPEIEGLLTQGRTFEEIPMMVKDAAALLTGEPEDSFEVEVVIVDSW